MKLDTPIDLQEKKNHLVSCLSISNHVHLPCKSFLFDFDHGIPRFHYLASKGRVYKVEINIIQTKSARQARKEKHFGSLQLSNLDCGW